MKRTNICYAIAAIALTMTSACAMGSDNGAMSPNATNDVSTSAAMASDQAPMVGGAAMYPTRNIIQNALNSRDHTTLVAAVRAAGLVDTLSGPGPFTVFAPTNAAFDRLPAGTVDALLQPANRSTLTSVLTYHVVAGRLSAADLVQRVRAGNGRATLTTVEGEALSVTQSGNDIVLTDARGDMSRVTIANVVQSNGVIHVVDTVLLPAA